VIVERMTKESRPPTLVVTVGGDGTLLAASHALGETPILAVNSAPEFSVGFFAGAVRGSVRDTLAAALDGSLPRVQLTRMAVERDGEVLTTRVLNEVLLCANSPAATSRYVLRFNDREEDQKSSGLWIGPAAGSTAAIRAAGGRVMPLTSKRLQFVVREPYSPAGRPPELLRAVVRKTDRLEVHSKMWEGRIFVDGQFQVYPISYGEVLRFRPSSEPLTLLGALERPTWMKNLKRVRARS
jgi:NAD+ kinase